MRPEHFLDRLIADYRSRGILIDTNLLLLDVVGRLDPKLVSKHKRTAAYSLEDFILLEELLGLFSKVVTTPHILTEVSNLSAQAGNADIIPAVRQALAGRIGLLDEQPCTASSVVNKDHFRKLGLTDSAILAVGAGEYLVLTDDVTLALILESRGADVVNFNHIRTWFWT